MIDIIMKIGAEHFESLRAHMAASSPMQEALDQAVPIDYSVDDVTFSGYEIGCTAEQAQILLDTAKQCCPEAIPDIQKAQRIALP